MRFIFFFFCRFCLAKSDREGLRSKCLKDFYVLNGLSFILLVCTLTRIQRVGHLEVPAIITGTSRQKRVFDCQDDILFILDLLCMIFMRILCKFSKFLHRELLHRQQKKMDEWAAALSSDDEVELFDGFDDPENPEYPEAAEGEGPLADVEALGESSSKKRREPRSRYFTWTLNVGKTEPRIGDLIAAYVRNIRRLLTDKVFSFVSVGHEVAPTTGENHLQGYSELWDGIQWTYATWVKEMTKDFPPGLLKYTKLAEPSKQLGLSIWVRASLGSALQNITYTGKAIDEGLCYVCNC
jgi:hypothetical protein